MLTKHFRELRACFPADILEIDRNKKKKAGSLPTATDLLAKELCKYIILLTKKVKSPRVRAVKKPPQMATAKTRILQQIGYSKNNLKALSGKGFRHPMPTEV